jgi:dipeptidyl aminopeptidase/acylaminoacyl peptidase
MCSLLLRRFLHGDRDQISSAWHAVRLHDALRAAGNDSTLWVYGGYGHDLSEQWDECRQLLLRFFQQHFAAPR